jgi:NADH dehydrogenase FAD-containing subunit
MKQQVLILGAGYAGMETAIRLAGKSKDVEITLVNGSPEFVERIRLHQRSTGQRLQRRPIADLLRGTGARFVQATVTAIRPEEYQVVVQQGNETQTLSYDMLVYALGSRTDTDAIPGIREYAYTVEQADALHERLGSLPEGARVVICGGGLTGIESSSEIAEMYPHLNVTMLEREHFGDKFSAKGAAHLRNTLSRLGVTIQDEHSIQRITPGSVVTNRGAVPFDVCLWAGSFAVGPLARAAGIRTDERGQILVDEHLRSVSHPDIYAAGDAARVTNLPYSVRMACQSALPMGAYVADALATPETMKPFELGFAAQCISLGRRNGLVQMVYADDSPRDHIYTGAMAAMIKELICKATVYVLLLEKRFPGIFPIMEGTPAPAQRAAVKA